MLLKKRPNTRAGLGQHPATLKIATSLNLGFGGCPLAATAVALDVRATQELSVCSSALLQPKVLCNQLGTCVQLGFALLRPRN